MTDSAERNTLWSDFLTAWPPGRVRQMTLEDYTNLDRDDAFTYWIEARLEKLGSIWGGSAFKFGIYCRDKTEAKEPGGGRVWGERYAWLSKYGATEPEAFATIRGRLIGVLDAVQEGKLARIEEIDLAPVLKWKVAFLYQDRAKPLLLPIYKKEMLFYHYRSIDPGARLGSTPYHVMYETLLERHLAGGDVLEVGRHLWEAWDAARDRTPRAWAVPLAWTIQDPEAIEALCNKRQVEPEDVDPFLDNLLRAADLAEGDQIALLVEGEVRALGTLTNVEPGQYAWNQVPVNFPSVLLVNPTTEVMLLDAADRQKMWGQLPPVARRVERLATVPPSAPPPSPTPSASEVTPRPEPLPPPCEPSNIILYGPPGTGKTYRTVRRALEVILGPDKLEGLRDKGLLPLFREHQARGQIEFVTFHQAYGYEEFVEGIRPVLDQGADAQVRYEIHDGVFKRIALRAAAEGLRTESAQPDFDELWEQLVRDLGSEGTRIVKALSGKTYQLSLSSQGSIWSTPCQVDAENNLLALEEGHQTASRENAILYWKHRQELGPDPKQFTYEKTTQLFAREKGGTGGNHYTALLLVYTQLLDLSRTAGARKAELIDRTARVQQALDKPGPSATFSFSARSPQYVLIIDEINRGNMSKILGELITLLEPDKRLAARNELKLPLSYTPQHRFAVPPNLHVLGTMNTADRSIALMDVALRRRFTFEELMPDAGIIREILRERIPHKAFIALVADLFDTLNDRIRFLYDRDHQLGHSYFLDLTDVESLRLVFRDRLIPMLQEYFYGAWDKICIVLGCPYDEVGMPKRHKAPHLLATGPSGKAYAHPIITARTFPEVETLGFDHDDYEDRVDYQVRGAFQRGDLSPEDLYRTFLGVLALDAASYQDRLAELLASDSPQSTTAQLASGG